MCATTHHLQRGDLEVAKVIQVLDGTTPEDFLSTDYRIAAYGQLDLRSWVDSHVCEGGFEALVARYASRSRGAGRADGPYCAGRADGPYCAGVALRPLCAYGSDRSLRTSSTCRTGWPSLVPGDLRLGILTCCAVIEEAHKMLILNLFCRV